MAFDLTGKNILITGGTAGIGLAVAKRFVNHGANVVISGRRDSGEAIAREIGAFFVQVDLTVEEDIEWLFDQAEQQLGSLHVVINNAGKTKAPVSIVEQPLSSFDDVLYLNLRFAYQVLHLAARRVVSGGSIINTASIAGMKGCNAGSSAYAASKAALINLTKTAALELASRNVRVNVVSPGLTQSEMWGTDFLRSPDADELAKVAVPMKRFGTADEVAAVYHFLAADESAYVTGANYVVDGGRTAGTAI